MTNPNRSAALCRRVLLVGAMSASMSVAKAQTAPTATTAAPKTNETIVLTPFQVSTDKDVGYAAGNTLSGGRVDTPLAVTPGSISVMTKEFMDDFNITDMNQAGSYSIGFDLGVSVPNSDPSSTS